MLATARRRELRCERHSSTSETAYRWKQAAAFPSAPAPTVAHPSCLLVEYLGCPKHHDRARATSGRSGGECFRRRESARGLLRERFGRRYLFLCKISRVGKAGEYVLTRDSGVGVQKIFDRIPVRKHLNDKMYRNSPPLDARLTIANVGVYLDSLMHGHLPLYEYYSKSETCDSFVAQDLQ